jgi:dipeptidyl aminopeptidase/acylaminoacyl peptidase
MTLLRWLIKEKIAAADRICIFGEGFGGYAALMSAVKTPDLYRCAASLNGISDLHSLVAQGRKYVGGFYFRRHIGRLWWRQHLLENSPRPHAGKVGVPVLLTVSEKNRMVSPLQTRHMHKALQRAKKDVELVELPEGDHSLSRQADRKTFAEALLSFLAEHLGEAAGTPSSAITGN